MGDYTHRTTFQRYTSTPPSELPEALGNYVDGADLSAVAGFSNVYWILTGDVFTLMDQTARDAVDVAAESDRLDEVADELDQTQTIMKAFAQVVLDEINILRAEHGLNARTLAQLKAAVRSKL